jgi:MFS family permease
MGVLALVSLCAFVGLYFWERHCPDPLLPLDMFRNKSLAALFTLSLFAGFVMFAILFYVPLLLQGGFGLSPQEAGIMITPMVVFITVGSIVNSRIITHLGNPNLMLYGGFGLMVLSCLGFITMSRTTPASVLILIMVMGGLGLGFVLPNLTVYAQETAGRFLLGIATALLQSVRMIGGMLGMAIVGTLVTHYYVSGVREGVRGVRAGPWVSQLEDPQVLVNVSIQERFVSQLRQLGIDGAALIESARQSLVWAIHSGLVAALLVTVLALLWTRRLPPISFSQAAVPAPRRGKQRQCK